MILRRNSGYRSPVSGKLFYHKKPAILPVGSRFKASKNPRLPQHFRRDPQMVLKEVGEFFGFINVEVSEDGFVRKVFPRKERFVGEHADQLAEVEAFFQMATPIFFHVNGKGKILTRRLPFDQELKELKGRFPNAKKQHLALSYYFTVLGLHDLYTVEVMDAYAEILKEVGGEIPNTPIIEIDAGDGFLSRALKERGLHMMAVDNYSHPWITYGENVINKDSKIMLQRLKPRIVIGAWISRLENTDLAVIKSDFVEHFFLLGDVKVVEVLDEEIQKIHHWQHRVRELPAYAWCRDDFHWSGWYTYPSKMHHLSRL